MFKVTIEAHWPRRSYAWDKIGDGKYCWVSFLETKEEIIWVDPKCVQKLRLIGKEIKRVHHRYKVIYTSPNPLHFPADWEPIGFNYRL